MAPSGRTTTSRTKTRRTRKFKRTHFKKRHPQGKKQDSSKDGDMDSEVIDTSSSACSTPKGQKFRIPEISTCPSAPKKPRVLSNCALRRSPLAFFAPPDLELFFFVAQLRDVSVPFVC